MTLELRELGSRDRVMGDANIVKPSEKDTVVTNDDVDALDLEEAGYTADMNATNGTVSGGNDTAPKQGGGVGADNSQEIDNFI